jgi:endonuclease/exonuclease/phosphatase family metal-dependent hydrolase
VTVVGVHIPNGSRNGWEKIYALEAVAAGLASENDMAPCILAGDFNEPFAFAPEFLSARAALDGHLEGEFRDLHGVQHLRRRWQDAVEAVLRPRPGGEPGAWDGTHTIERVGAAFEPTHITGRDDSERFFDHILTSGYLFSVRTAGYDHSVRVGEKPVSDHSIVFASLAAGGEQFDDELGDV